MSKKTNDEEQHHRPLFEVLSQHRKREKVSFHVPGHKNGVNWDEHLTSFSYNAFF